MLSPNKLKEVAGEREVWDSPFDPAPDELVESGWMDGCLISMTEPEQDGET